MEAIEKAVKFLKKQEIVTQKRIINAISNLPKGDVKKLQNRNGRRLRVGDYRVIFDNVENIDNRGQVYKGM